MEWLERMNSALEYIEDNIAADIKIEAGLLLILSLSTAVFLHYRGSSG